MDRDLEMDRERNRYETPQAPMPGSEPAAENEEWQRLKELAILLIHQKSFEGARELALTRRMVLHIALQACLPILRLGLDCVGCCWALMALGFVGGVMNLAWMGLATLFMVVEKLPQVGHYVTRPMGFALTLAGIAVLGWPAVSGG